MISFLGIDWTEFKPCKNVLNFDISVTVNYSAVAVDYKLFISTIDLKEELLTSNKALLTKTFTFDALICKICTNTSYCLILLENGDIFQIMIGSFEKRQVRCLNIEGYPERKSIFVKSTSTKNDVEKIIDIAIGETVCIALTSFNAIYNIPNLTFLFKRHVKVQKICCGNEHSMILTGNGDVFTWGTGLRGQLGHQEIKSEEEPKLVEGLAGIKVVDISSGGWSSAAVSAFGDLYVWGWNSCGQLGLRVYEPNSLKIDSPFMRPKNQTVYSVPTLVSLEDDEGDEPSFEVTCKRVFCGSKHMLVLAEDGRIFVTGSNTYNQIALAQDSSIIFHQNNMRHDQFIDHFTELKPKLQTTTCSYSIYCAYSCTLFIEKVKIND